MEAPSFAFEGVVRLTRLGGGYLLFTLVLGFAALNTGNNSLYIGLAFMLGGLFASGIASKGGLSRFDVELTATEEVWAEVPAKAILKLRNRSWLWNVRDVIVVADALDRPVHIDEAPRRSTLEIPIRLAFERRGRARISRVDLYTRYPFGLVLKKRRIRTDDDLIVYPSLLADVPRLRATGGAASEASPRRRAGGGHELFAFREYVRGDSVRHVHWKKSASVGRWIVRQLEEETSPSIIVVLDPVVPAGASDAQFERLVSEATTVLKDALDADSAVTLILPGEQIRGRGIRVRRTVLEALALVQPRSVGEMPILPSGAMVFSLRSRDDRP
ncbi:MAG TPA: DUF58 domain-containing protein [Thermoanaerobaculia bacterium]|nr:DUF58 domain-containing protein [Thermoanaerobaculia bacterium]